MSHTYVSHFIPLTNHLNFSGINYVNNTLFNLANFLISNPYLHPLTYVKSEAIASRDLRIRLHFLVSIVWQQICCV